MTKQIADILFLVSPQILSRENANRLFGEVIELNEQNQTVYLKDALNCLRGWLDEPETIPQDLLTLKRINGTEIDGADEALDSAKEQGLL